MIRIINSVPRHSPLLGESSPATTIDIGPDRPPPPMTMLSSDDPREKSMGGRDVGTDVGTATWITGTVAVTALAECETTAVRSRSTGCETGGGLKTSTSIFAGGRGAGLPRAVIAVA